MIIVYYIAHTGNAVCYGPFETAAHAHQWIFEQRETSIPEDAWHHTTVMSPKS